MKSIAVLLVLIFAIMISCEKERINNSQSASLENPLDELSWLAQMKAELPGEPCPYALAMAKYNSDTVFYSVMVGPACDAVFGIILYNREGVPIKQYQMGDEEAFGNEVQFIAFL